MNPYDFLNIYEAEALTTFIFVLIFIIVAALLAFIPAHFAKKRGHSYGLFWVFGFFLFAPALIVSILIEDKTKAANPATFDSADEIARYKALFDDGVISREEFEQKKNELLRK